MKKLLFLLIAILPLYTLGQTPTKSLLWKITSPNSEKTSYLYGTMHISGRLAFHLGEEFFESIMAADAIALESNPIIWLDEIFNSTHASDYLGKYGFQFQTYKGFYQEAFKLNTIDNKKLGSALSGDHYLSNWMLYRENKSKADFEEETFLDLFIYQTGMKNKKPVYSLENFTETTDLSKLGDMPDPKKKEKEAWFEELTEEKNARSLIEEAYRNKDIMFLDSLHSQINSDNFIKYMLEVRNDIMAVKIDSFIQVEDISLFIGIGAAHLGGEYGVIQMLKDKGYTVEPMSTTITDKAKATKEAFDLKTTSISYDHQFKSDLFTVSVPGTMYETPSYANNQRQFFSPELTNGSYFSIKQISTYSYFTKINQDDYFLKVDSLLFESIPGDIVEKTKITKSGFDGLDIINQSANGNYQRYQIFFTPLNIFIFKMGGKNEFVKDQGQGFFDSIKLTPLESKKWTTVTSLKNDFSIKTPAYYHIKNNTHITSLYGHQEMEAFDPKDGSFYFLKRASLHDFSFIEQDNYELNRLVEKFFEELDIDSVDSEIQSSQSYPTIIAHAVNAKDEHIELKIIINGSYYYLISSVSKEKKTDNLFLNSFKVNSFKYNFPFDSKTDSTLLFTVKSNYIYPTKYADLYEKAYKLKMENQSKKKEDLSFKSSSDSRIYYSENFERVYVEAYKYHNYAEYENIDSLWSDEIKYIQRKNSLILRKKEQFKNNDIYTLNIEFADTNSSRVIMVKEILKHGLLYTIRANIDTLNPPSEFVSTFFNSFTPLDTLVGQPVFDDKSEIFLKNIYSEDSLTKEQALQSVKSHIKFDKNDFESMKKVILSYPFTDKQIEIKKQMIADLGKIDHRGVSDFLINLYPQVEDTAMYQLAILEALANQSTKKSCELFLDLLDQDIPLSSRSWGTYAIYAPFFDSLELANEVFPELLNYTFISQYKTPTYSLLSMMVSEDKIKRQKYKKNYKQILREAKIELKSQISQEQSAQSKKSSRYSYSSYKNQGNSLLVSYSNLLFPFYKKSAVQEYFSKLGKVQDFEVQTLINIQKIKHGIAVEDTVWSYLAADLINRNFLYQELEQIDRLDLFPAEYKNQQTIVESLLYDQDFNPEKDSMLFIEKHEVVLKNDTGFVYFFKSKGEYDDDWSMDYVGLQPKDKNDINIEPQFIDTGIKIEKYKKIDEIIKDEIEAIQLEGHKRAKKSTKALNYDWFY